MKNRFRGFSILVVAVFFLLLSSSSAEACSCSITPTVDIIAEKTPYIAIFKVESVEEGAPGSDSMPKRATLVVEKVFKGNLTPGEKFVFSNEGICLFRFEKDSAGRSYLLYLDDRPVGHGVWAAGMCTRSGSLRSTSDDILYLEKRARVRGKTRLSGSVWQKFETEGDPREWYFKSLAGIPLRIRGKGTDITLKTDENGSYEIYDLPAGKYDITPPEIKGFAEGSGEMPGKPTSVQVFTGKHTEENFYYDIYNSISGKMVDEQGLPVAGACSLELVPTSFTLPSYGDKTACTDINGEFRFSEILSGTYILVANKENKITPREPFSKFYYPDKDNPAEASIFTFAPGVHFTGLVIKTPGLSGVINLNGVMRFSDGKPVAKATVYFFAGVSEPDQIGHHYEATSRAETDDKGNFRIRIMRGQKGLIVGSFTAYRAEYKHCLQIRKVLDERDVNWKDIETPIVRVDTGSETSVIELKYPFPACPTGVGQGKP